MHEAVEQLAAEPAAPPRKVAKKRKLNGAHAALPVPAHPGNGAQPEPVSFARFGEFVVLRMSDLEDLAELVARLERWRPIAELVKR